MLPHELNPAASRGRTPGPPPVSIVVPTSSRRPELLLRCLDALSDLDSGEHELVVVDNGPGDATTRELAARSGALYLCEPQSSLSRARTVGARACRGRIVAFIDDDAVAQPGWIQAYRAAFSDPAVAAAGGRILPLGEPDEDARAWVETAGQDMGEQPVSLDRGVGDWFERANFGGLGSGGNMAFRRDLFDAGWGFHEDLGEPLAITGEEHFAFFELIAAGWRVGYVPTARVKHRAIINRADVELQRRRLIRGVSAYMLFLLLEARGYRRQTLRYLTQAARGKRRDWRPGSTIPRPTSRRRMALESAAAPLSYLRSRLSRRPRLPRSAPPAGPLATSRAAPDGEPRPQPSVPS